MIVIYLASFIFFCILASYLILSYNHLRESQQLCEKSSANIRVLLKQRFDEVPQLVNVCKGHIEYEKSVLESLTNLRLEFENLSKEEVLSNNSENTLMLEDLDSKLTENLELVSSLSENYPELKSSTLLLELQKRLSAIEDLIADRREYYNEAASRLNSRIDSFPDNFIAQLFKIENVEYLKFDKVENI